MSSIATPPEAQALAEVVGDPRLERRAQRARLAVLALPMALAGSGSKQRECGSSLRMSAPPMSFRNTLSFLLPS
jgi:hypothetical protein